MATYTVRRDSETWKGIADQFDVPCGALLRSNSRDPSENWPDPAMGDELALPPQPDDAAIAPNNDHMLDLEPAPDSPPFDLPPQKKYLPEQPDAEWVGGDVDAPSEPIRVAANDDNLVRSLLDMARKSNAKRNVDDTVTSPGGRFIPVIRVVAAARPDIRADHGFLDDGKGNIDNTKRRAATASDYASLVKWEAILHGAELARPDLEDATKFYAHFLGATGTPTEFSYDKYAYDDRAGACALASAIDDVRAGAIEIHERLGLVEGGFVIQTASIPVGSFVQDKAKKWHPANNRYPYAGTENWQKTIGAHFIWLVGLVRIDTHTTPNRRTFAVDFILHAEDRYNFNPGNQDMATGAMDAENGRFEITGVGQEFDTFSTLVRTLTFSLPLAPADDFRARPADFVAADPRFHPTPGDPVTHDLDGGLPPGGT